MKEKGLAPEPTTAGAKGRPVSGAAPETPESRETFPQRTKKPGTAGLANEARPGLGTRADESDANLETEGPDQAPEAHSNSKPKATPHGYEEPRPAPREQASDSMAHELERSTGASGQSGNG